MAMASQVIKAQEELYKYFQRESHRLRQSDLRMIRELLEDVDRYEQDRAQAEGLATTGCPAEASMRDAAGWRARALRAERSLQRERGVSARLQKTLDSYSGCLETELSSALTFLSSSIMEEFRWKELGQEERERMYQLAKDIEADGKMLRRQASRLEEVQRTVAAEAIRLNLPPPPNMPILKEIHSYQPRLVFVRPPRAYD